MVSRLVGLAAAALLVTPAACGPQPSVPAEQPAPAPDQAEVAQWAPDNPTALDPSTTAIDVTVYESACASGQAATRRVAEPDITYGDQEVVVTIRVIPSPGDQSCPANPPTPFTVELDEPLDGRALLDGGQQPPGPPHIDQ
ncbi:MAG: hypothetical protein WD250_02810 [Egibacteraceae bacterium]